MGWRFGLIGGLLLLSCARSGPPASSVGEAQAALLVDPTSGEAWAELARAQLAVGDALAARSSYERARRYGAEDPRLESALGMLPSEVPTAGPMGQLHRDALSDPDNDELWGDLADHYRAMGDSQTALRHYLYAFSLDPGDSEWLDAITELGALSQVLEQVDALASSAVDDEQLGDLADVLRRHGEVDRACELYAEARRRDPDDSEWTRKTGRCEGGSWEDTAVDTGGGLGGLAMIGLDTGGGGAEVDGWLSLGRSYAISGERDKALEFVDRVLAVEPGNWEALVIHSILDGGSPLDLRRELAAEAADDELWGDLGDAFVAAGRFGEALDAYRQALELDPADSEWQHKVDVLGPLLD